MPKKIVPWEEIVSSKSSRQRFTELVHELAECWRRQAEQDEPIARIRREAVRDLHIDLKLLNKAAKDFLDGKGKTRLERAREEVSVHEFASNAASGLDNAHAELLQELEVDETAAAFAAA